MIKNNTTEYLQKLTERDFLPLLPAQLSVAERVRQELTKDVKASMLTLEAHKRIWNVGMRDGRDGRHG